MEENLKVPPVNKIKIFRSSISLLPVVVLSFLEKDVLSTNQRMSLNDITQIHGRMYNIPKTNLWIPFNYSDNFKANNIWKEAKEFDARSKLYIKDGNYFYKHSYLIKEANQSLKQG
jgi:hypothetical protein